jgi:hypothetical protein
MRRQIQSVAMSQCAEFMAPLAYRLREQVGDINETSFRPSFKHEIVLL